MHLRTPNGLAPGTLLCWALLCCALAGCQKSDPRIPGLREQLVLADEPAGAVTIADARDHLKNQPDVVVVGKIQASQFDPWAAGKAAFVLSEAPRQ